MELPTFDSKLFTNGVQNYAKSQISDIRGSIDQNIKDLKTNFGIGGLDGLWKSAQESICSLCKSMGWTSLASFFAPTPEPITSPAPAANPAPAVDSSSPPAPGATPPGNKKTATKPVPAR